MGTQGGRTFVMLWWGTLMTWVMLWWPCFVFNVSCRKCIGKKHFIWGPFCQCFNSWWPRHDYQMWWPQHYWKLFYILLYILFCRWELGTWLKSTYGVSLVTVISLVSRTLVSVENVVTHSLDMTKASQGRSQILLPIWAQSWNLLRMRSQIGLSSRVTNWLLSYCILLRFDLFLFPWNVLRTYGFFYHLLHGDASNTLCQLLHF